MKTKLLSISLLFTVFGYGQDITLQLHTALQKLSIDSQFKHAIISLYVVASKTGKVIIDKNAQIGLAPASCQKVVTSVAAFELLGKTFRYKTDMGYDGIIKDSILNGNLHFTCYGDPSLGSWRWPETGEVQIQQHIIDILKSKKISIIKGNIIIDE
ncbi:MAG: D-alanyl-D-alanine carboxypeptidase, partial [Ferruginibacter sp.]